MAARLRLQREHTHCLTWGGQSALFPYRKCWSSVSPLNQKQEAPLLLPQLYKALTQWAPKADVSHQPLINTSTCSCSISSSSFRTFHSTIPPTPILQGGTRTSLLMVTWRLCRPKELDFHLQASGLFLYHSRHPTQDLPRKPLHLSSLACHVWQQLHIWRHFSAMTSLLLSCTPGSGQQNWSFPTPVTRNQSVTPHAQGDIIQAQQLARDYSLLAAHAQRGTEDGDSRRSTVGKQLGWAANWNTHPNPAQCPHFHLSFPFLRNSLEGSGLQWLQQLLQLLWCLPLLGSHLLYLDPQGFLKDSRRTSPCSVKILSTTVWPQAEPSRITHSHHID